MVGRGTLKCFATTPNGPWDCHEKFLKGITAYTPMNDCTFNAVGTNSGSGGGGAQSNVYSYAHSYSGGSCSTQWSRPAGSLISAIQFYNWTGSGWNLCRNSGWSYSSVETWGWGLTWSFGSSPPCGAGYYHTAGFGYLHNGFEWKGGYLATDYLYLSGSSALAATAAPAEAGPVPPKMDPASLKAPKLPQKPSINGAAANPLPAGLTARPAP